ncbi:MAG TPA: immunoglobulin domain-containing protein [Candidatus Blautia merdavium]|uniref:Immunoglobulin domain-containing protein n=1 Tax=Candidatus Blautia merdavium TaxID=2838494 RepID=A0A9D2TBG2_9FIRM|nr:immunoglobulin domain-containing protein [Candidatus Blautia merdavium]
MKKRLFAAFVCLCMIVSLLPTMAFAEAGVQDSGIVTSESGLCEHHTQHDESCGYTEGTAEIPCSHEHDESCGGLTDPEACNHTHDEACGYVPATEGTPCTYVCEICNAQDSGNPEAPSDAQPEECTCETLCTEEEINGDCPVCSAEGADLDKVCVGAALLLTAPTLRTGEIKLFIGGQQITESGCYENKNGTWTKVDGTEPANGQFSYDAATFTLTLNEAEITNNQTVNVAEGYTYDGSVIAFSQTADVSLKIVVSQGTSTITGNGGIRVESTTGNASLSIKGSGSLDVEPKGSNSGITLCSSKNTNLDIDGADVTASSPAQYGVYLISSTDASSTSTITVNNGSLTTGGNGNVGIYYYWSGTSNAGTSSLTVSGNAVVDTRNSQIMDQNKETVVQVGAGSDGNGGIVFNGKSGTVYGDVTLQEDLEIGNDETLTIGKDASLTVPDGKTLTNNGTINVESGGKLEGTTTGNGTLKIAPTITTQPQDVEVKENETATFNVKVTGTEPLSYQWQQSTDNGQSWTDITGETNATYTIATTTMDMSGTQYRCVVKNSIDEVTSDVALLKVKHNLVKIEYKAPTCTVNGNEEYWTCDTCDKYFSDANGDTEIAKDSWIISAINHDWNDAVYTWSDDGSTCTATRTCKNDSAHTETSKATVTDAQTKVPTCTEKGETTYTATFEADWAVTQTKVIVDIPATGHSYGEPEWSWSEDGKTCTVTFTCEKDETHKETPVVTVTSAVKTPATCTETGVTTYTATVEFNGQIHTDTKDVADIPATGHSYGKPVWNWSEDGKTCTVTFTCEKDETHKESPKVDVTSAVKTPATCTETGVTTYTATVEFNGQTYTDTKDVADIPATGHSYDNGKCTVCGAIASDFKVIITAGANGSWQKGTKDGLTFTSNAAYKYFQKVQVDGKDLDASNYTVKEGSTIVTLKTSYLETLSVGKHTLAIVSETGTATTEFTIKAAASANDRNPANPNGEATESVQTGDNTNMMLWIVMLFVSASILGIAVYEKRKKHMEN